MVTIRSVNEIILSLIDYFNLAQPDLDIKPGTVARDLMIDSVASQLSILYNEMSGITNKNSLRLVSGSDLDKLASNYGVVRKQATASTGVALLTFSSINATININAGDTVIANNGFSYSITTSQAITTSAINLYRATATKFSNQLAYAGITDQYAVQATVAATTPGSTGNIGTYQLNTVTIPGVSNVTNVVSFVGGTDQETDAAFRNRILASFSGSSVGTALGYLNTALATTGVSDAIVIGPGSPLMTRDGTISKEVNGTLTVISEGSGGKVDVYAMGSTLIQNTDSFIYQDQSNDNDPTNIKNNVVLGQIAADSNLTVNQKRIVDIQNGTLPNQPVNQILSVTGSISGANFIPKSVDAYGRIIGNYELIKDTGIYAGSPWGFDTFHWISNQISLFSENLIKGQFDGQDATTYNSILEVPKVQQSVSITNENSTVTTDRSIIKLLHTPASNVTRVFNVNTGERYTVVNQNYDQTGIYNTTGRIKISGNTLPSPSNQLQVDYSWIVNFDQYSDYDGLVNTNNPRAVSNSVDWGYASAVRQEFINFTNTAGSNFFIGNANNQINTVISANTFTEIDGIISPVTSGVFVNRISVVLSDLSISPTSVNSIVLKNSNTELFATAQNNGSFAITTQVVGAKILYIANIILPTDTSAQIGDEVSVILNSTNVYTNSTNSGSFSGNQITIPISLVNTDATSITLSVVYIANLTNLYSSGTSFLPASRLGNGFNFSNNGFNNFSITNISRRENTIVQKNLSNQYYIELTAANANFELTGAQVVSVTRLSDGYQLWTENHQGTVAIGLDGNFQLILSGFNNPAISDRVLVVYYTTDLIRSQPFTFSNSLIKTRVDNLALGSTPGTFALNLNKFTTHSNLTFTITSPNNNYVLFSGTDGYLVANLDGSANFSSLTVNFDTLPNLLHKKLTIVSPTAGIGLTVCNNDGVYDINSYTLSSNVLNISNIYSNITADQISVIRVLDGQEIWNYTGTIDLINNRIIIPATSATSLNDVVFVIFFNYQNLVQSPTRLISTTTDQVVNPGIITITGTTLTKADSIVFTATNTGLNLDLSQALRQALSINSNGALPTNVNIAKIVKVQKVLTASDSTVLKTLATYDVKNTMIQNNLLYANEMLQKPSLLNTAFILPATSNNISNLPKLGDQILITFYYTTSNVYESLAYSRNGALYTNNIFALINRIYVSSGFNSSQSTKLSVSAFTQPNLGYRYLAFYNYLAPQQNERIIVNYNYNQLISAATFAVESGRPINADVLVKEAIEIPLNLTMNVVISPAMISSTTTILQNLNSQLSSALTSATLGEVVDQITLINIAQGISGVDRARILYFNADGAIGSELVMQAQQNQYFVSNNIILNTETR